MNLIILDFSSSVLLIIVMSKNQRTGRMTYPGSADSLAKRGVKLLGLDIVIVIIIISSAYINKSLCIMSLNHALKVRIEVQYSR